MTKELDEIAELKTRLHQCDLVKARIENWELRTRDRDSDSNIRSGGEVKWQQKRWPLKDK